MHLFFSVRLKFWLASFMVLWSLGARAAQADWPLAPSHLDLVTPYGDLHVKPSEYIYESRLLINNADADPKIEGILNITYAFATRQAHAALISINNGNSRCPIAYRWVVLDKKGYKMSPEFGSCSPQIKVSSTNRTLVVKTPNNEDPNKIDTYSYDGKTVKRHTQR
ncbi:MAG TPA: hypothetical protein VIR04_06725 [Paralcaligenes sp.]|jgi:hypothetical protein